MKILHKKSILGACVGLLVLVGLTGVTTLDLTPFQTPRTSALPFAPYLYSFFPNPDSSGSEYVSWSIVFDADNYTLYRDTSFITDIGGLIPIVTETPFTYYFDSVGSEGYGTYYYVVVATNIDGDSPISNCQSVEFTNVPSPGFYTGLPQSDGSLTIMWGLVPGAIDYSVYRESTPIVSTSGLTPVQANTTNNYYSDILTNTGNYYYAVTSFNGSLVSAPSINCVVLFQNTTLNAIVPNPASSPSISLDWNDISGAELYMVFRNDSAPITAANVQSNTHVNMTATSSWVDILLTPGTYYYAVLPVVMASATGYGLLSNCQSVVFIGGGLPAPSIVPPVVPAASGQVDLTWTSILDATTYNVYRNVTYIADVSGSTLITTTGGLSYSDTLSTAGTYYYAVTAVNVNYESGPSVNVAVLFQPVMLNAIPAVTNPSVTLDWNDVIGANGYYIFRNNTPITMANLYQQLAVGTNTSSSFTDTLPALGTYYYAILPLNSISQAFGVLSNCQSVDFVTLTQPFFYPPYPKVSGAVDLQWTSVPGAISYKVYRDTTRITDVSLLAPIANPTGTTYTDNLLVQGEYFYAVTAVNATDEGPVSNCYGALFRSISLPAITPNPTSINSITLDWGDVTGADTYMVIRNATAAITETNIMWQTNYTQVAMSTYTETSLPDYGTYYYAVMAADIANGAYGLLSNSQAVVYMSLASPSLDAITPENTSSRDVNLNWNDVPTAIKYYVYRDTNPISDVGSMTPINSPTGSAYADTLPATFDTYYYVVVATNGAANSSISTCVSVTYNITAPVLDAIMPNVTFSANIDLNWNDITGATGYHVYRDTSPITDVGSMTPINSPTGSAYTDTLPDFGSYYYVVVSTNGVDNTTFSNCVNVSYVAVILNAIVPARATVGPVSLDWNDVQLVDCYYVYRAITPIIDVSGMTPIAAPVGSSLVDNITSVGTYYYVVVASNVTWNSSISNNEAIMIVLDIPVFNTITPNPTTSTSIALTWSSTDGADHYLVYSATSTITSVSGLTPIANVTGTSYTNTVSNKNGTYYYVVVAVNQSSGFHTLSNCVSVTYTGEVSPVTPPPAGIPGMSPFLVVAILAIMIGPLSRRMRHGSKR